MFDGLWMPESALGPSQGEPRAPARGKTLRYNFPMIRIGTSEPNGTFYTQGHALKAVLEGRSALAAIEVLESHMM